MAIDKASMRGIFIAIGALAAFSAAVATTLSYFAPDKSSEFLADRERHRSDLDNLVDEFLKENNDVFESYKDKKEKVPDALFKQMLLDFIKIDNKYKEDADSLVDYLNRVAGCEISWFCKISNVQHDYDELIYAGWFWFRPYILEARKTYVPGFGLALEKYAKEVKLRFDKIRK